MPPKKGPLGHDMPLASITTNRLEVLKRLQQRLSQQIDVTGDERSLVLLATRLQSVMAEIDKLAPASVPCIADQIAARRRRRSPA